MGPDRPLTRVEATPVHEGELVWDDELQELAGDQVVLRPPQSYREAFGGAPIRVGIVEFKIMRFLASKPYHAFTRRQISAAISLPEAAVDRHIDALRDQLGVLHDFVQSVPQVGYRFKP